MGRGSLGGEDDAQGVLIALRRPIRRRIMRALVDQPEATPLSPKQLANRFDMPLSNVGWHVRVLVERKMIRLVDEQPSSGSIEHFYAPTELADHPISRAALAAESRRPRA
jgi:DNA-binding transcriptional ArsR family regulator